MSKLDIIFFLGAPLVLCIMAYAMMQANIVLQPNPNNDAEVTKEKRCAFLKVTVLLLILIIGSIIYFCYQYISGKLL